MVECCKDTLQSATLLDKAMFRKNRSITFVFVCLIFVSTVASANETKIRVVTSFSILEDLVSQLGGEEVSIVNLVGRNSDAHTYQPKPSDAVAISKADLVVFNGLEFEGWISRLVKNSGYENKQLIASRGVETLIYDDEVDPHAWQSFRNVRLYIKNITQALIELRPQQATVFEKRKKNYLSELSRLEKNLLEQLASIPQRQRVVVTSHDAFGYLARELQIQFLAPVGLNIEVDASAEDVAEVINQIREKNVQALFVENITNPRLLERISAETGVAIGGRLYSDALSELGGPAGTYIGMMTHNIESLISAFQSHSG